MRAPDDGPAGCIFGNWFPISRLYQSAHSHACVFFSDKSALPISAQSRVQNCAPNCALIGLLMYSQLMYSFGQSAHSHACKPAFITDL